MNDFLKNLRNAQRRSPPKDSGPARRETGDRYTPGNERRATNDRRAPFSPQRQQRQTQETNQYLPIIQKTLATMTSTLEKAVDNQEKLSHAQIKQHESVTAFIEKLTHILTKKIVPILNTANLDTGGPEAPIKKSSTSYARGTHYTKDEIIEMIQEMRVRRSTYDEIAQELMEKGIPTFSGRGKWHAQTIHRLCKTS